MLVRLGMAGGVRVLDGTPRYLFARRRIPPRECVEALFEFLYSISARVDLLGVVSEEVRSQRLPDSSPCFDAIDYQCAALGAFKGLKFVSVPFNPGQLRPRDVRQSLQLRTSLLKCERARNGHALLVFWCADRTEITDAGIWITRVRNDASGFRLVSVQIQKTITPDGGGVASSREAEPRQPLYWRRRHA